VGRLIGEIARCYKERENTMKARDILKNQIQETADLLGKVSEIPQPPALGLDLDGTIDEAPWFFQMLAKSWDGPVYVLTYRDDEAKARQDVENLGVKVDDVICVRSFAQKAAWIKKLNIVVYFDDMDEVITHIPEKCKVFKVRNGGNFSFEKGKWYYDDKTGINIRR
jgi:hypothetical protein